MISSIDWKEFVLVKTIDFTEEEEAYLPPPYRTIEEINRALNAQSTPAPAADQNNVQEVDMDMDVDMDTESDLIAAGVSETLAPPPPSVSESEAAPIIVKNYDYQAAIGTKAADRALKLQKCPVCFQEIPIESMAEHMRIELLDPKWRELREAHLAKHKTTNIAADTEITKNLERMARRRFGNEVEEDEFSAAMSQMSDLEILRMGTQKKAPAAPAPSSSSSASAYSASAPAPAPVSAPIPPPAYIPPPVAPVYHPPVPAFGSAPAFGGFVPPPLAAPQSSIPAPLPFINPERASMMIPPTPLPVLPPAALPPAPAASTSALSDHQAPEASMDDQPPLKKHKGSHLMNEHEFMEEHPEDYSITVYVPQDSDYAQFNFNGQQIKLTVNARMTFSQLKDLLAPHIGNMPANKQKLRLEDGTFPKNEQTLAYFNLANDVVIELVAKERAKKRKD